MASEAYRPGSPPESILEAIDRAARDGLDAKAEAYWAGHDNGARLAGDELARLRAIIDRSRTALSDIDRGQLLQFLRRKPDFVRISLPARDLVRIFETVSRCLEILAEADPEDLEV